MYVIKKILDFNIMYVNKRSKPLLIFFLIWPIFSLEIIYSRLPLIRSILSSTNNGIQ